MKMTAKWLPLWFTLSVVSCAASTPDQAGDQNSDEIASVGNGDASSAALSASAASAGEEDAVAQEPAIYAATPAPRAANANAGPQYAVAPVGRPAPASASAPDNDVMPSQAAPVEAIADDAPAPVSTGASTGVSTEASTGASTTEVETVDPGPAATVYHALKKEKAGPAPTATVSERAVSGEDNMTGAKAVSDSKTTKKACKWHLGIHTGLDLGGAIPWPLSDAISKGDKMNVVPKISPALGMSLEYDFLPRWGVVLEATYKTVGMDASIITLNGGQKFSDDGMDVIFYGRAKTSMSFTSFETPLYFIFRISDHNRVFAGGYYAYVPSSKFVASALDGHVVNPDNGAISVVNPASPIDQDFSDTINDWDAGWLVGYERRILSHLTLSGRFSMGLNDIFKPNEKYLDYGMIHMRGTVTLSYRFF